MGHVVQPPQIERQETEIQGGGEGEIQGMGQREIQGGGEGEYVEHR